MTRRPATACASGFTLVEILVVVVIIGIISAGVLLSISLTGRDRELEGESDRLYALVNYAREQAELQTREYGVIVHDDSYQFVAYDSRRGIWREVYEDDALRQRRLPAGLDFRLLVDARPVILTPTDTAKKPAGKPKDQDKAGQDSRGKPKTLEELLKAQNAGKLKEGVSTGRALGNFSDSLNEDKPPVPQLMIFSNGDLSSFELTMERDGGLRSVTFAIDEKGQVIEKPLVERKL